MEIKLDRPRTLAEISKIVNADLSPSFEGDNIKIDTVSTIEDAKPGSISFLANPIYKKYLPLTQASAVVLSKEDAAECTGVALISTNPRLSLAKLLQLCNKDDASKGVHPTAIIGKNVKLGKNVTIGAYCVVGDDCSIGDNTELKANVSLYARVTIGSNCCIHSGAVIGSDGFGYAMDKDGSWFKMPHLGGVVIGNNVEIGANTCIDRGMLGNTEIGDQVIIDNLVQIAHNVKIGEKTAIAGCVGIAGSTSIGKRCMIGGACTIAGHISITDGVHLTGASAVSNSIHKAGVYSSGMPAKENSVWRRNIVRLNTLDQMAKRLIQLEKTVK